MLSLYPSLNRHNFSANDVCNVLLVCKCVWSYGRYGQYLKSILWSSLVKNYTIITPFERFLFVATSNYVSDIFLLWFIYFYLLFLRIIYSSVLLFTRQPNIIYMIQFLCSSVCIFGGHGSWWTISLVRFSAAPYATGNALYIALAITLGCPRFCPWFNVCSSLDYFWRTQSHIIYRYHTLAWVYIYTLKGVIYIVQLHLYHKKTPMI